MKNAEFIKRIYKERALYLAEPLVEKTDSWTTLSSVGDESKTKELDFKKELYEKALYVAFIRKDNKCFARLYIVDMKEESVRRTYVRSNSINPIKKV